MVFRAPEVPFCNIPAIFTRRKDLKRGYIPSGKSGDPSSRSPGSTNTGILLDGLIAEISLAKPIKSNKN